MPQPSRRGALLAPVLLSCLLFPTDAFSQNLRRRLAYTDPKTVDADFAYQGEYLGAFVEDGRGRQVGLQVVAQGDGSFLGVEYAGGLPGTGWDRRHKHRMTARIRDGIVHFQSPEHRFAVVPEAADVLTLAGEPLGKLEKVLRVSPTMGRRPPKNAVVLFDGRNADRFKKAKVTRDGLLQEGTETVDAYRDFTLHLEFRLPYMPHARGQGRGNSGVYLQRRYEVQILDSFGLEGKANECAGLYTVRRPDLNICLPPLQWQTYDITFRSPQFDRRGKKVRNARVTVRHNGVLVHDDVEVPKKTGAGRKEGPNPLPILLQNHHNPVRFRNIWLVKLEPPAAKPNAPSKPRPSANGSRSSMHRNPNCRPVPCPCRP